MPEDVIQAFAGQIAHRDVRRLEPFLSEYVAAQFDVTGELLGRSTLLGFWRRLFQNYTLFELHVLKSIAQDSLVLAEGLYLLRRQRGPVISVRAITVFEVQAGLISHWRDYADLAEVPAAEKDRWRRLKGDRW